VQPEYWGSLRSNNFLRKAAIISCAYIGNILYITYENYIIFSIHFYYGYNIIIISFGPHVPCSDSIGHVWTIVVVYKFRHILYKQNSYILNNGTVYSRIAWPGIDGWPFIIFGCYIMYLPTYV